MERTYVESEISLIAKDLLSEFNETDVWIFIGEMGAGKTTLTKQIGRELGVVDEMSSPTFSIINEYLTGKGDCIYHFDFYRLEEIEEAIEIGVEDYFYSKNRCLIEWPQLIMDLLPDNYLEISIKLVDDNTRHLTTRLNGPTF